MIKALTTTLMMLCAMPLSAETQRIADLSDQSEQTGWRFFTDRVMGGLSQGEAKIANGALTLIGEVSTANNGGFIQARREGISLPEGTQALRIHVRGDGQTYYIHLRTSDTHLPWQYYQAPFAAPPDWTDIHLPLFAFKASGARLPQYPEPADVRSIALVAYGRDHTANVSLAEAWAETGP